ncbi:hypothetical protein AJ80_01248 [Polytolypa hystricis UAMH7299]|uniref:Uncharacterized protein n=1 Tax=Polytolypa hystricis (strain UAMH7299) TaxID=1447883 RepID=A0A2B7Z1V8_POLH7|nr:hypothetical protein AJ80_01248 [Polytolypa hystricis UAMH7299]
MPDPEETVTRYHTAIFVETGPNNDGFDDGDIAAQESGDKNAIINTISSGGHIHEVTGDIATSTGMYYYTRPQSTNPAVQPTFHTATFLGLIRMKDYPQIIDAVCRAQPAPPCQKKFNTRTMRYEAFKSEEEGGGFYAEGEVRKKGYFKCTEWTEERIIPALEREGVFC